LAASQIDQHLEINAVDGGGDSAYSVIASGEENLTSDITMLVAGKHSVDRRDDFSDAPPVLPGVDDSSVVDVGILGNDRQEVVVEREDDPVSPGSVLQLV
jgi:hypothetical protein